MKVNYNVIKNLLNSFFVVYFYVLCIKIELFCFLFYCIFVWLDLSVICLNGVYLFFEGINIFLDNGIKCIVVKSLVLE